MADPVLNALSLCSGIGGLELGLSMALPGRRVRVLAYVERDAAAAAVLLARMEDQALEPAPVWCGDLSDFPAEDFTGQVDVLTAGFPCQPWSVAGLHRGRIDERWLWPEINRIVRVVGPGFVFLENVPGLVTGGGLPEVLRDLAILGFDAEWGLFSASEVGAPHLRKRVFVLAFSGRVELAERGTDWNSEDPEPAGTGLPLFPPGPDKWKAWAEIITRRPDLAPGIEPGLCRVADGAPGRVDRLRLLGNAVVPIQAAYAFRTLARRAGVLNDRFE